MQRIAVLVALSIVLAFTMQPALAHDPLDDEVCVNIPEMDGELMQVVGLSLHVVAPDVELADEIVDEFVSLQCSTVAERDAAAAAEEAAALAAAEAEAAAALAAMEAEAAADLAAMEAEEAAEWAEFCAEHAAAGLPTPVECD